MKWVKTMIESAVTKWATAAIVAVLMGVSGFVSGQALDTVDARMIKKAQQVVSDSLKKVRTEIKDGMLSIIDAIAERETTQREALNQVLPGYKAAAEKVESDKDATRAQKEKIKKRLTGD